METDTKTELSVNGEKDMSDKKREYKTPTAEKVEFDYKESVVACSEWPNCMQNTGSEVSTPYWECKSPDHWGC